MVRKHCGVFFPNNYRREFFSKELLKYIKVDEITRPIRVKKTRWIDTLVNNQCTKNINEMHFFFFNNILCYMYKYVHNGL